MRILITGITGYIGSNLARELLGENEIYGLVRRPLHSEYIKDIQQQLHLVTVENTFESVLSAIQTCQPDLVYHLATHYTGGHGEEQTPKLVQSNIVFGAYLLEAMSICKCQALVYASTVMAHFNGEAYNPLNLYAATKQAFSDLLTYYTEANIMRAVTLVLSDTYGPDDNRPKILNVIKNATVTGEKLTLSDGKQDYDVVFIDDVVAAFKTAGQQLLAGKWKNEVFQVCASHPLSLHETVRKMLEINKLVLHAQWGKRETTNREMRAAIRCYPILPEWKPVVSLEEGLTRLCGGIQHKKVGGTVQESMNGI